MEKLSANPKRARKAKVGDVFALPLGDGTFGFCQACKEHSYVYFDLRSMSIPTVDNIISSQLLFRVPTAQTAPKEGGWIFLENRELRAEFQEMQLLWNQPVGSNEIFLYKNNEFIPASKDEVDGLEVFASWFHLHIVERILDHYNGRVDGIAKQMNRFKVYDPLTGQEVLID